jgi:hypothetical protein
MKRPETQDEFGAFVAIAANRAYLDSPAFAEKWAQLEQRSNAGEQLTVAASAVAVDLPVNVFRHLLGHLLAGEVFAMGEAAPGRH